MIHLSLEEILEMRVIRTVSGKPLKEIITSEHIADLKEFWDVPTSDSPEPYWKTASNSVRVIENVLGEARPKIDGREINVLDMGCSWGETTQELCSLYPNARVIGIDIEPSLIEDARKLRTRGEYHVDDGYKSKFPDRYFDIVFCNNNVWYVVDGLSRRQAIDIFGGITRLVKDRGYLVISRGAAAMQNYVIFNNTGGRFEPIDIMIWSPHSLLKVRRILEAVYSQNQLISAAHLS